MLFWIICAALTASLAWAIFVKDGYILLLGVAGYLSIFVFGILIPIACIGATDLGDSKTYPLSALNPNTYVVVLTNSDQEVNFKYKSGNGTIQTFYGLERDMSLTDEGPRNTVTLVDQYIYNEWLAPWKWESTQEMRFNISEDKIVTLEGIED